MSSIVCAVSDSLERSSAAGSRQGIGAAFLLGASLPLLVVLSGDRARAIALWVAAGTLGTAVGPALGGVLTEAFDWRAIFAVQAPLAAAAIVAALHPLARGLAPPAERGRVPLGSALALVFTYAALVGALFLSVLLVVTAWDYGPLAGAAVVSALPLAALAARPLSARLSGAAGRRRRLAAARRRARRARAPSGERRGVRRARARARRRRAGARAAAAHARIAGARRRPHAKRRRPRSASATSAS